MSKASSVRVILSDGNVTDEVFSHDLVGAQSCSIIDIDVNFDIICRINTVNKYNCLKK